MDYDNEYLMQTIAELKNAVKDLSKWSVHNADQFQDYIYTIRETIDVIVEEMGVNL